MVIDPERTDAIDKIGLPSSKKAMQSFLGKIKFIIIFVPNFAQILRPLQDLVKKYVQFKWFDIQRDAFSKIWKSITEAPALMSPDFDKEFILYTFSTDFSYVVVLTHKQVEDIEIPILFMSSTFKGAELN